jgi:CBS domain-containing protein
MDIAGFLAEHPPFRGLTEGQLAAVASTVQVEFFPAGSAILEMAGPPADFLYVVRKGAVEILDGGRLLDLLEEGESFGHLSLVSRRAPTADVRAGEDTLCYLVPKNLAEEVLESPSGLAFVVSVVRRQLGAMARLPGDALDLRDTVRSQVKRELVTVPPEASAADAARLMTERRVSSLLVPLGEDWGIVTDRDLRSRVLATGRSAETPVREFLSSPVVTVPSTATAGEVLLTMLEHGWHHAPVTDASGQVVGMVTDTDLMGLARQSPFALKGAIERAPDEDAAVTAARTLPGTAADLVEASVDPVEVGRVIGVTIDTLSRRLLELAMARLGEPPAPWAWLVLGSEARHEQALYTDQDHALVIASPEDAADVDPEVDAYFEEVAKAVTSGLESAGIHRCRGDAMAENRALRRSVEGWIRGLRGWMADPGVEGSVLSSIVFDFRKLAGPLDPEPRLDAVVAEARTRYPQFLRHLARRALDTEPPTGFRRDLVVQAKGEHAGTLDVKHRGIMIVTNLARTFAVRAGRSEKGTLQRLRGAVESGQIDEESRGALDESFRLLWEVRLEHQVGQFRRAAQPDDFVDPRELGPIRRRALKEAFRLIEREQRSLASDLGVR